MKNKEFHKLLKKTKSNSGFTLTELLVGLFMSIFVVGALGFGLMQILGTTKSETSRVAVRNETSRALDFISDEVRRASTIETNAANANGFDAAGKTVVFALDIPEVNGDSDPDNDNNLFGVDNDLATEERVVYFLQGATNSNWKGPLVLYRYGPPLDANGNYTDAAWGLEALIDGIDDTATADPCVAGDTLSPATARGFHACINGGNTAQLYLTGGTDTASGGTDTYTADTKVFARANDAPANRVDTFTSYTVSFRTLGATYNCTPGASGSTWKMRTDFGNNPSNNDDTTSWIHQDNRQPQPIQINTSNDLTITTVPVAPPAGSTCLSKGDENATGDSSIEPLSAYTNGTFPDGHTVPYTVEFTGTDYWHTFNGDPATGSRDVPDVTGNGNILVLKRGSTIAASLNGYDYDNDNAEDQDSLGKFLKNKGFAEFANGSDASGGYTITNKLGQDERIMAVEVGQTDTSQPGFDVQDSVFILSSDIFAKTHSNP